MRPVAEVILFSLCVIFGVFVVSSAGIGGTGFTSLDSWSLIRNWAITAGAITILIVGVLMFAGTKVLGSGPSERLPDATSWTTIGVVYALFVGYVATVFFKIDDTFPGLGTIVGSLYIVVTAIIFVFDLHESIQSGGK